MLSVSVVIPARNESEDIRETIEACLRMTGPLKEIVVVDDSEDDTPDVVRSYADRGVRLVHRDMNRNGCCGARNEGLKAAQGDICVLLNADARPSPDYLEKILPHYEAGADYLIVESKVRNTENLWGCYLAARAKCYFDPAMHWSEGFSCRRAAALAVGGLPGDYPLPFCRDYMLNVLLLAGGYRKQVDRGIAVEHIVPDRTAQFWREQIGKGCFLAPTLHYMKGRSLPYACARTLAKAAYEFACGASIVYPAYVALKLKRYAPRPVSAASLFFARLVCHSGMGLGHVKGAWRLAKASVRGPA